jgi:Fusaric acid resistance protein-like
MTETTVSPVVERRSLWAHGVEWIRKKDPGYLAIKRSARAAITMPTVFGVAHLVFSNPQVDLFSAFGSFDLLLLVDFPGRPRTRLVSYLSLWAVGCGLIALGTVFSTNKAAAVAAMAVVGFLVLFLGIVSSQVATASTATLLLFVLPVAVAQPAGAVGSRILGWALAGAGCTVACMVLWPTPWHDNLRRRLSATLSAVAALVTAHAEGSVDDEERAAVSREFSLLRNQFATTPYPPTGAAKSAVAVAKLVGRVEWTAGNAALVSQESLSRPTPAALRMIQTAAETLRRSASLICDGHGHPVQDPAVVHELEEVSDALDDLLNDEITSEVSGLIDPAPDGALGGPAAAQPEMSEVESSSLASVLDPGFSARALGFATLMVAHATLEAAGARAPGSLGMEGAEEAASAQTWRRLVSHLSFRSVWFRNAIRGAAGLALAVAVVEITDVEHGFWVVLGTLSVLRTNALGTGATALRAVGGTAVGFVVGSAIMIGVGGHTALLWILLPLAVLVSGVAPSMISFAAGQAGFTLVVIILFNIIVPSGWRVGLTRIEDVAIGCGVSVVVGLLFWPRGAMAALGRALSDAFVQSSAYLADAVNRLTTSGDLVDTTPGQRASHSAYLRLDDAFRQFMAERGAKVVSVQVVANLVTGSNRIRLAAFTLSTLPVLRPDEGQAELESVAVAGAVLRDSYASSHRWYEEFGEILAGQRDSLDRPPDHDATLHGVLRNAFEDARVSRREDRLRAMLQMLWADELLETQRQVQSDLASTADLFTRRGQKAPVA